MVKMFLCLEKTHAEYEEAIKDDMKSLDPEEEEKTEGCGGGGCKESSDEGEEKVSEEESLPTGKRFSEEVKDVLAALESLIVRAKAIEVLRSKDGRTLSERASSALRAVQEDLNDAWTEIDDILVEASKPEAEVETSEVTETVEETPQEEVAEEISEDAEIAEAEVEVVEVEVEEEVVEEEEAETEEVVLEEVDEEIEALFAESQSLIADSILVELDDEEV